MFRNKYILEKVSEGHLEHNTILVVRVTEIMWNRVLDVHCTTRLI